MKWHEFRRRGATAVLCGVILVRPVSSQVSAADSARAPSHLEVHLPFFIPFFHHRHQAGRAGSAQPDSTVLLRVDAGYDGNFRSPELDRDESSTINIDFTPNSKLEVQADLDFWAREAPPGAGATTGRGDMHFSAQWTAFTIHPGRVAVALEYVAKIPTATRGQLGTGWVDHRMLVPASFALRGLQVDGYAGIDANGSAGGLDWGPEAALTVTARLGSQLSAHAGVSAQTLDTDQPAGGYISGGISWQLRPLFAVDLGGRLGVSPGSPSFGLTAGITTALLTR